MSHATDRMWQRFGFYVSPQQLLRVIRAGNAKERLMMGEGDRVRKFDVPITFENGTTTTVRCLVSLDLKVVITITPPETPKESLRRKEGEHKRKVFKSLKHGAVDIDEAVAPVELDEAARGKLEQERKSAKPLSATRCATRGIRGNDHGNLWTRVVSVWRVESSWSRRDADLLRQIEPVV